MSYFSPEDALNQKLNGVDYYFFVKKFIDEISEEKVLSLGKAIEKAVNKNNVAYSITGERRLLEKTLDSINKLSLGEGESLKGFIEVECEAKNEGFQGVEIDLLMKSYDVTEAVMLELEQDGYDVILADNNDDIYPSLLISWEATDE
jgi:hypothetical protein